MKAWLCLFLSAPLFAQDWQNRNVGKFVADVGKGNYAVAYIIPNFRTQTPNNANLLFGVGRGDKKNWLEVMAQKQWNRKGGFWALDARFRVQLTERLSFYAEPAVFATQPGLYHFVVVEYRVWNKLSVGGEEESIHRPENQPQQLNFGSRLSVALGSKWGFDLGTALAYRLSLTGPNEFRWYTSVGRRFDFRRK